MKKSPPGRIDWSEIDGVILDVDGTLFDHLALRRPLAARMLAHLATRRLRWRDVLALRHFRRQRDRLAVEEAEGIGGLQFERAGLAAGRSPAEIETLVSRWMHQEPLAFVPRYAFPDARRFVLALQRRGTPTGVFSDYPAQEKLGALQISVDVVRDAACSDVGRLKPCPNGFLRVAELLNVRPARCLVIGDRDDRDGEAARRGGFLFLRKTGGRGRLRGGEFRSYAELMRDVDSKGEREQVLCLLPHPDDEFAIFAEIEAAVATGSRVVCVYLTDGAYGGQSAGRREAESRRVLRSLGVADEDIHFVGAELGIADCTLFRRVTDATTATLGLSGGALPRWRVLMPAWEGGHHDHDAAHLVGLLLLRGAPGSTGLQYPVYQGNRLPGSFFHVLSPLPQNGPVVERRVAWADRVRYLRYCLSYPSQWKTWVGLFPHVLMNYLFVGRQRLQRVDPARVAQPPHGGELLYERRGFCTWQEFAERTHDLRSSLVAPSQ